MATKIYASKASLLIENSKSFQELKATFKGIKKLLRAGGFDFVQERRYSVSGQTQILHINGSKIRLEDAVPGLHQVPSLVVFTADGHYFSVDSVKDVLPLL